MLLLHIGRFSVVAAASAAEAAARFSCQPHHTNWKIIPCLDPYIDWEPIYVYQTLLIIYIRFWIYLDFVWFHCIYFVFRLSSLNRIIPIPNKWIICSYKSYNFSCVCAQMETKNSLPFYSLLLDLLTSKNEWKKLTLVSNSRCGRGRDSFRIFP